MLNRGAKIDSNCPKCKHKLTFTVGQLQSGETITCQNPNCHLKLDTSEAQKSLAELEKSLKAFRKRVSKTISIKFKL